MRCVCYSAETKNTLRFIHLFIHYHKCIITITKRQFLLNKKSLCLSSEATFSWIKDRKLTDLPRGSKNTTRKTAKTAYIGEFNIFNAFCYRPEHYKHSFICSLFEQVKVAHSWYGWVRFNN